MRTLVLFVALTLAGGLSAQTTVPAGYLTKSGGATCIYPLVHYFVPGVRVQAARPGGLKKSSVIKTLSYRTNTARSYSSIGGMGRKWTTINLSMGYCNAGKMSSVFSLNPIGKMTKVYKGAWSVPNYSSGIPKQTWGNAGKVPFSTIFVYNGTNDILEDWVTLAGTMANGFTGFAQYYIDDCVISTNAPTFITVAPGSTSAPGSKYVPKNPASSNGCNGHPNLTADAFARGTARIYADNHPNSTLAGKFDVTLESFFTRPGAGVVGMLTLGGSDSGSSLGAKCNKLHVNPTYRVITSLRTASNTGYFAHVSNAVGFKYQSIFKGLTFHWQCAWEEKCSGSGCVGQLGLSIASKLVLPDKPTTAGCPGAVSVYRWRNPSGTWSPNNTNASYGAFRTNSIWKGIVRYAIN